MHFQLYNIYGSATPPPPAQFSDNNSSSKGDSNEHRSYRTPITTQPKSPRQKTRSKRPHKVRTKALPSRNGQSISIQVQMDRRELERLLQEQNASSSSDKF